MKYLLIISIIFFTQFAQAQIAVRDIKSHIIYLSSDKLEGRAPGTKGEKLAYEYIIEQLKNNKIPPAGSQGYLQPFTYKPRANPHDTIGTGEERKGNNVIGFLDNQAAKTIIIGAHYDHLGTTGEGASLDANPHGKIHNGADDNASGVAGVLALSKYFQHNKIKENYNFLFAFFSAEEAGLIGSKFMSNSPDFDKEQMALMINFDMIGRLKSDSNFLMIYGIGTSPQLPLILETENRNRFQLRMDSSGIGPSDQTSFYLKNIPVLHFFTGQHQQYHKPDDDSKLINYKGEAEVLNYVIDVLYGIMREPHLPFTPTKNKQSNNIRMKITMGVMPDYAYSGKGMRIDGVTAGKPAAISGIQAGDIITKINGSAIDDIYDYMDALKGLSSGDVANVSFLRGGKPITLQVQF